MMSSGVAFRHHNYEPDRNDMYFAIILRGEDLDVWAADLVRRVLQGTDFNFLATDTHVLGAVLRAAYDQPLGEIMTEQLWQPFGFSSSRNSRPRIPRQMNMSLPCGLLEIVLSPSVPDDPNPGYGIMAGGYPNVTKTINAPDGLVAANNFKGLPHEP